MTTWEEHHEKARNLAKSLRGDNPTKRLMAEAILRSEFDRLKEACKKAGYKKIFVAKLPGETTLQGPSHIAAWPAHSKRYKGFKHDHKMFWRILDDFPIFKMGCGNGSRDTFGDQAQMNYLNFPPEYHGEHVL